jgi:adenylosuccinate synthase
MASKKTQATKAGAGAVAAGKAVKNNPYVQRIVEDEELRENVRTAFESARKAYGRMSNGKGPVKAITEDKKTQKQLREAATSLREAADSLKNAKKGKKKRKRGRGLMLLVVGAGLAIALNEGLRSKVLDVLFGSEEEFEYSSTTSPEQSSTNAAPVGSTS